VSDTKAAALELVARLRSEAQGTDDIARKVVLVTAISAVCASYGIRYTLTDASRDMRGGNLGIERGKP